jgi:lipopolysaccharide export system permease protein
LLSKPILLVIACILAAIFGIGHNCRNKKNVIYMICGILLGLILHILISIIHAFGASGVIEIFIATWFVAIILFLLSSSLLIKKEI